MEQKLKNINHMQQEIHDAIKIQLDNFDKIKHEINNDTHDILQQMKNLEEKKRTAITPTSHKNIGEFKRLDVFIKEQTIIISSNNAIKTGKIRFSPVNMAFILYLTNARINKEEWIENSEITNIDEALKASQAFRHIGLVGCTFIGHKGDEPLYIDKVKKDDYVPDSGKVRKYASQINKKIRKQLQNKNFSSEGNIFIRTPDSENLRDGRYFIVTSIDAINIIE